MGACIGDALGSYCEFNPNVDEETMKKGIFFFKNLVMTVPGGGTFKTQPGQFTDDS